ncbi:MAG: hypothetical protein WCH62_07190 [Candidatus Omnitrophota bacterium]
MIIARRLTMLVLILALSGCGTLCEFSKSIWGSTTRVLEDARSNAITKTYEKSYWDCFKVAANIISKKYVLFQKNEVRGFIVVMGIPGSVDTTEVGVFFVEINDHKTRIELSSLSTNAKRLLAKGLFHYMDIAFGLAPMDQEKGFLPEDFKNAMTAEGLLKDIKDDGFPIDASGAAIDSLNNFLENDKFYDLWKSKKGLNISLTQEALDIIKINTRNIDQIKRLNRLILEETYPTHCPKNEIVQSIETVSVQK